MLSAIGAFYRATNEVTRRDFHTFTNYLLGKSNFTQALEWIPRVPAVARTAMEAAARSEGLNGFQFTERSLSGKIIAAGERRGILPRLFSQSPCRQRTRPRIRPSIESDPARGNQKSQKYRQTYR